MKNIKLEAQFLGTNLGGGIRNKSSPKTLRLLTLGRGFIFFKFYFPTFFFNFLSCFTIKLFGFFFSTFFLFPLSLHYAPIIRIVFTFSYLYLRQGVYFLNVSPCLNSSRLTVLWHGLISPAIDGAPVEGVFCESGYPSKLGPRKLRLSDQNKKTRARIAWEDGN